MISVQFKKYRINNQERKIDFLSAAIFLHYIKGVTALVNAIEFYQILLMTLATNHDNKQHSKFCVLCKDLVMNCFNAPVDQKIGINNVNMRGLNEFGNRVFKLMYENDIFFLLCLIASDDDIFDIKVNSAAVLGEISKYY